MREGLHFFSFFIKPFCNNNNDPNVFESSKTRERERVAGGAGVGVCVRGG